MHATEVHDVRTFTVNNNEEYGTFFLWEFQRQREDGSTAYSAELTANTSFGVVGYYWSAMGCPAKEFFKKTDMHYLGTKLWGASSRLFDCGKTLRNIRSDLLAQRRQRLMDKDEAMAIWDDLQSLEHCSSQHEFLCTMADLSHIDEWLPAGEVPFGTCPNPQLVGFFEKLWPGFVEAVQQDQAPARGVVDEDKLSKLRVAAMVIANLPQLPDYNGSILTIDDDEARRIASDINAVVAALQAAALPAVPSDSEPVAWRIEFEDGFSLMAERGEYLAGVGGCVDVTPLYAAQPAVPSVPDGWALVPKRPTPEMLSLALSHVYGEPFWRADAKPIGTFYSGHTAAESERANIAECGPDRVKAAYAAMLAAAPKDQP